MSAPSSVQTLQTQENTSFALTEITLKGILSFKTRQTVELKSYANNGCKLAVIVGSNGSGKSNIIRCFLLMMDPEKKAEEIATKMSAKDGCVCKFSFANGWILGLVKIKGKWSRLIKTDKGEFAEIGAQKKFKQRLSEITNVTNINQLNVHFKRKTNYELFLSSKGKNDEKILTIEQVLNNKTEEEQKLIFEKVEQWTGWKCKMYKSNVVHSKTYSGMVANDDNSILLLGAVRQGTILNDSSLMSNLSSSSTTKNEKEVLNLFKVLGISLLTEIESAVEELLWFLVALDSKNSTIVLDEPDKMFHPDFVRKMLDELSNLSSDKSVIIISHSQEIVDWCNPKNLFKFTKENDETFVLHPTLDDSFLELNNVNELFFNNHFLLLEGKTDYAIFKNLRKFVERTPLKDLVDKGLGRLKELCKYTLIQMNGKKNGPLYIKLCKQLRNKVKILYDRDGMLQKDQAKSFMDLSFGELDNIMKQRSLQKNIQIKDLKQEFEKNATDNYKFGCSDLKSSFSAIEKDQCPKDWMDKQKIALTMKQDGETTLNESQKLSEIHNKMKEKGIFIWWNIHDLEDLILFTNYKKLKPNQTKKNFKKIVYRFFDYMAFSEQLLECYSKDNTDIEFAKDNNVCIKGNPVRDLLDFIMDEKQVIPLEPSSIKMQ